MKRAGVDMDAMMQQAEFLYEGEFIVNYASIYTANTGDLKDYVETLKKLEAGGETTERVKNAVENAKRAATEASRDLASGKKDPILKNGKFQDAKEDVINFRYGRMFVWPDVMRSRKRSANCAGRNGGG